MSMDPATQDYVTRRFWREEIQQLKAELLQLDASRRWNTRLLLGLYITGIVVLVAVLMK